MSKATQNNLSNQQQETISPSPKDDLCSPNFASLNSSITMGSSPPKISRTVAHAIQDNAIHDEEPFDYDVALDSALSLIQPIECSLVPENSLSSSIFRRPYANELFTVVANPIIAPCYYMGMHHECGHYSGDACFPMNAVLQDELKVPARALALYPCVAFPNKQFIFPQVLERRDSERNSRDASLAKVLSFAPGNWVRLCYDEDEECFQYDLSEQEFDEFPEYPGFVWDCLNALGECFDDEPEHPLQILIREQQRIHMRL
jgi:hypothetical protein